MLDAAVMYRYPTAAVSTSVFRNVTQCTCTVFVKLCVVDRAARVPDLCGWDSCTQGYDGQLQG